MSKKKAEHFFGRELVREFTRWADDRRKCPGGRDQHGPHLLYWIRFLEKEGTGFAEAVPATFERFQSHLLDYTSRFGRPLAINTQLNILSALKVFYAFLHESGRLHHNPAAKLRLPKERKTLPTAILTAAEARRLLKKPDTGTVSGFRDRTILEVLYSCGLRIGELRRLKEEDFDSFNRTLTVREGKGRKDRVVPVGETACLYLKEYIANVRPLLAAVAQRRAKRKPASEPCLLSSDSLFLNRFGKTFGVSGLCKKLKGYARAAKIEKNLTVHGFRHTLATSMLQRGAELRHIQAILGHDHLHATERYTRIAQTELRRVQAKHHPREAIDLPEGAVRYRGIER